ncbi:sensor histidine kinase [Novosphingobium sp. MBES04]|uniref:sensor histidine kinase n=1 Tax=Novosphingobium sp. MBES04 TaxID=1206458 RepID=UPI0006933D5B|nr:sensor histidine kinase [Novosphingobium sp. MBES04]
MSAEAALPSPPPTLAPTPALRTRLLVAMLGPMVGVAIVLGVIGALIVTDAVRRANDRVLGGALGAIAETVEAERGEVTLDLPAAAFGMLENPQRDAVFYRVAVGTKTLTGDPGLPPARPPALDTGDATGAPSYRFATFRGRAIRIAELHRHLPGIAAPISVQIAETLDHRRALGRRLILALVLGEALLIGLAVLLLRPALGWSLRPLARLREAVARRSRRAAPDLSPLDAGPLPRELVPLSRAFDSLLERLDTATAGMRRFTADASHQMRTPLSTLKVQLALARRGDPDALREIADAADRLEHLMTQLLALARAEEAGVEPEREQVDLHEVAVAVINRRIGQAIAGRVELQLDAPDEPVRVWAHRTLVFEMLSNLVDNAIRYGGSGGEVEIAITQEGALSVTDRGPGLAEADMAQLGQRFVRFQPRSGPGGSGLGFAIVRSAAQRVGATIHVEAMAPGLRVTIAFAAPIEVMPQARSA